MPGSSPVGRCPVCHQALHEHPEQITRRRTACQECGAIVEMFHRDREGASPLRRKSKSRAKSLIRAFTGKARI
jgi:hypothetical protein